jgi:DNA mismatch endonuclease (patch repair protein)
VSDIFAKKQRSALMSRIRGKNTGIEVLVFRFVRSAGIHFLKHYRKAHGSPDLAVPSRKLAIFVDGDFWHGYRYPAWAHKLKSKFWRDKIERNRARDRRNFTRLRRAGWRVLRVWEHNLLRDTDATLNGIVRWMKKR